MNGKFEDLIDREKKLEGKDTQEQQNKRLNSGSGLQLSQIKTERIVTMIVVSDFECEHSDFAVLGWMV